MNKEQIKNPLLEGGILKSLIKLSIPIILATLLATAYQITDAFWVGRLGKDAVAAVSLSWPIMFLVVALGGGLAMAGTILAGQYKGQADHKMIDFIAGQTITMITAVALILSVLAYLLTPFLVNLMHAEANVYTQAVSYLRISFIGMIAIFGTATFQSLMRGIGDVKTPVYIIFGTVCLNFLLDPLFMFGWQFIPALGVSGVAIATVMTEALAAIIGFSLLFSGKYGIHLKLKNLKPDWPSFKKIFRIGFPSSIEQSMRAIGMAAMTLLVAQFGTVVLAAYGVGGRMFSFVIIPAMGLSIATSTMVAQNIGAGLIERAQKITKIASYLGFWSLSLVGILMFVAAAPLSTFFIPGENEVIHLSALFIKMIAVSFGFMTVAQILTGTLRGAGDTFSAMVLAIISFWVFQFPLAFILSKFTNMAELGIWLAFPVANILSFTVTLWWFNQGKWKNKKITSQDQQVLKTTEETMIEEAI